MKTRKKRAPAWAGRLTGLLLALLLLAGCAGCGQRPAAVLAPASSVPGSTDTADTPEPEPQRELSLPAPVTFLSAVTPTAVPAAISLGDGRALSCWTRFDGVDDTGTTYLDVIDLIGDTVERSATLEGYLPLVRGFADGAALLISYEQSCFYLLDETLRPTRIDVPNTDGQFSADHRMYYYAQEESLYAQNVETGAQKLLSLPEGIRLMRVDGIHPTLDYLTCWVYTSIYSSQTCYAVIDPQTGELLLLQDITRTPSFQDGQFYTLAYDYDSGVQQLSWGELLGDAPLQSFLLNDDASLNTDVQLISGCSYALQITPPAWDQGETAIVDSGSAALLRMEPEGLSRCDLTEYGLDDTLASAVYLPELEALLAVSYSYDSDDCTYCLIAPGQLTFTGVEASPAAPPERIDQERRAQSLAELEEPELSPALEAVRARADGLEERFGIEILLSAACAAPCAVSGYYVTTTDQAGLEDEAASIDAALDEVEYALEQYPEDFFRQFRTEAGTGGIYLMLSGPIDSDDDIFVTAFEFGLDTREYICLDVTLYNLGRNLYHELWHATENKIFRTDFDGFYEGSWDALNPEGFSYRYMYSLTGEGEDVWQWTYMGGDEEVYFIDDYSKTYAKEDRARIMEYVMDSDEEARSILSHPVLRQKLEIMDEGIRRAFDTTGWEDVSWQKFL